ncbi:UNVERIFIED_ORG: ABC-2 type transport system ATP-binding protein [Arthrobacter sp. UYCu721]
MLKSDGMAIEAEELCVRYARSAEPQVRDFSATFGTGINALIGRNGAGKSTFMNAVVSLQPTFSGRLRVLGVDLPAAERYRRELMSRVGYLPQNFGFIPGFTVREVVEYAAWLKQLPSAKRRTAVDRALEMVGLQEHAQQKIGKLSGGMQRRVGIAHSIVHDPELVVLDEPTSGLDPEQRIRFRDSLRRVAEDRCVLVSSHLIEDVRAIATQVYVLNAGRLVFSGTVSEMEDYSMPDAPGDTVLERAYTSLIGGTPGSNMRSQ